MCGRFTLTYADAERLAAALGVSAASVEAWQPRYNIAPSQTHLIMRLWGGERELVPATWGLVNAWTADGGNGSHLFNARAETLHERPAFREAFERRRCVIPADGFYEWQRGPDGRRPYWFHREDGGPLLLAGLYEYWEPRPGLRQCTFTIITTRANATVGALHDRMPVILDERDADEWMFPGNGMEWVRWLLRPAPDGLLRSRPVSEAVNNVANDGPGLLEGAAQQPRLL